MARTAAAAAARALGFATLLVLTSAPARAQDGAAADSAEQQRHRLELDAVNLLQGADTLPLIDTGRVRLVMDALAAIRRTLPGLADIPVGPDLSYLVLSAADSVPGVFAARAGVEAPSGAGVDSWSVPVARAGIPAVDSLNRLLGGVSGMAVRSTFGRTGLALRFRRPVNVPIVAEWYARVPQVGRAEPPQHQGDGSWTALIPKGRRLHFVFARGTEDCADGCVTWDFYYVTFDTVARSVTPDSQLLGTTKWPEPVAYWDVPTRYDVTVYRRGVADVYAALRDPRWWHRQHALVVLGMLLGLDAEQWHGPPERRSPDFAALEREALSRRRDSYGALVERLADPDPDVAGLAHLYLRELTGASLPGGAAGIPAWRQWLDARYSR